MSEQARAIARAYGRGFTALRELAGFRSQGALAKAKGVSASQSSISEVEVGKRALKAHEIEWWCWFFSQRIPGYKSEDCLRVLREAAGTELSAMSAQDRDLVTAGSRVQSHYSDYPLIHLLFRGHRVSHKSTVCAN